MDIICAKCGKHFSSIEAAREHTGHCKATSKGESIRWIPAPNSKITPEEWERLVKPINFQDIPPTAKPSNKKGIRKKSKRTAPSKIKNWLIALIFIFALSICGLGISVFIESFIPFWLLFGFSLVFSIEKWLFYVTRKYKWIGIPYRLLLNLSILSLLGLIIWSGVSLFTQQFMLNPVVSSVVFVSELVIFIWLCRVVARNSWRRPSMKLSVISLICLFLIFSFAGVQPMANYKDAAIGNITNFIDEQRLKAEETRITEENRRATEEAEMDAAGVVSEYDFYKDYVSLFNEFRSENGKQPLVFDATLNKIAAERAIEISEPGNFSHEGIKKYNLGENIAMMAYSSDSAGDLIELWASSPGHRSNMLLSSYHRTGFAKNGRCAVQVFD